MTQETFTAETHNGESYEVVGTPSTLDQELAALGAPANQMDGISDEMVEEIMKKLAVAAVSKIPVVGQVLGPILGFLTSDRRSIWEQVEEQVKREIHKQIMEATIKQMRGINDGLSGGFKDAAEFTGKTQFDALLGLSFQFRTFRSMFQSMSDNGRDWFETLPFITILALQDTLCLSLLAKVAEEHDKENLDAHRRRFEESKQNYSDYIKLAAQQVVEWRLSEIEVKTIPPAMGGGSLMSTVTAKDNWTGKKVASGGVPPWFGKDKPKVYQEIADYKEKVRNEMIDFLMQTSVGPLEPWGLNRQIFDRNPGSFWEKLLGQAIKAIIENMAKK